MHNIVRAARVLSHPTRLKVLTALLERPTSPGDLSRSLGLTPEVVARHLATLRAAGLAAEAEESGVKLYSADAARVTPALDALRALGVSGRGADRPSARAEREIRNDTPLRRARTCHDHLAGALGVALLDAMTARGWLTEEGTRPVYLLTLEGGRALAERGVELERGHSRRSFAFGCMDWTERRRHVGGALGASLLRALQDAEIVRRTPGSRAVEVLRPLEDWLDAAPDR